MKCVLHGVEQEEKRCSIGPRNYAMTKIAGSVQNPF
jgi:hypothetical protein